jgi:hypothetical protein
MDEDDLDRGEPRGPLLGSVLAKAAAVLVAVGLLVGLGTWVLVKGLGLDQTGSVSSLVVPDPHPVSPLPSTALTQPAGGGQHSRAATQQATNLPSPVPVHKLQLTATPASVSPMERINLTGTYPGHDAMSLQVQRFEAGSWVDFPTDAQVDLGTFATYVMTGRSGENMFRVFDPATGTASNPVTVTVG